jgi:hypothetical protein
MKGGDRPLRYSKETFKIQKHRIENKIRFT